MYLYFIQFTNTLLGGKMTNLDKLQVCERSDVEVGRVLLRWEAAVELAVAAADGERLRAVRSAQRGCAVQPADVGRRTELCKHTHTERKVIEVFK